MRHSKRYMITVQEFSKKLEGYFKGANLVDVFHQYNIECDTKDEIEEWKNAIEEQYSEFTRPDESSTVKYSGVKYWDNSWICDDNHKFWGYVIMDFKTESCIGYGGVSIQDHPKPLDDLILKDIYFRKDNEVPLNYKWDVGEYEGWLKFRWGDGSNAIDKVRKRKKIEKEQARKNAELKTKQKKEDEEWLNDIILEEQKQ